MHLGYLTQHRLEVGVVSREGRYWQRGEGGSSRILIITPDFHTRRAPSIFRHEIQGKSFSVAAAYDDTQSRTRWWTRRQWAKTCVDEWLRRLWWTAVERWR